MAAAVRLHRMEGDDDVADPDACAEHAGPARGVVMASPAASKACWSRRAIRASSPSMASVAKSRARMALRQNGAGAQLLLLALLAQTGIALDALKRSNRPAQPDPTSPRRSARSAPMQNRHPRGGAVGRARFHSPDLEGFELALRQRDYFMAGPQALFGFMRTPAFRERAPS